MVNFFLRLIVKIWQFLRLTAKCLAVLRLTVNPIETLFSIVFNQAARGLFMKLMRKKGLGTKLSLRYYQTCVTQ